LTNCNIIPVYIEVYSHYIVYTLVLKYEKTIGIHMQKFIGDSRGVSVVVGAIMLTLIVVTAATSYAIFVSDQQKKIQTVETLKLQQDLENITILALEDMMYSPNSGELENNISFAITNMNSEETVITSMNINNNYIRHFNITRPDGWRENYTMPFNGSGKRPIIHPREQIRLTINISNGDVVIFKNITTNDAIILHIFTSLTNDFTKTFIPPTAIIQIVTESQWNSTSHNYETYLILDGSLSDHPGSGYIARWEWKITTNNSGTIEYDLNRTGRKIRAIFATPNLYHTITLTVTDNYGMIATDTVEYYY